MADHAVCRGDGLGFLRLRADCHEAAARVGALYASTSPATRDESRPNTVCNYALDQLRKMGNVGASVTPRAPAAQAECQSAGRDICHGDVRPGLKSRSAGKGHIPDPMFIPQVVKDTRHPSQAGDDHANHSNEDERLMRKCNRKWNPRWGKESGNQTVEFTLIGLPLTFLLFSIANMCFAMLTLHTLQEAVEQAARFVSTRGSTCSSGTNTCTATFQQIVTVVANNAPGINREAERYPHIGVWHPDQLYPGQHLPRRNLLARVQHGLAHVHEWR